MGVRDVPWFQFLKKTPEPSTSIPPKRSTAEARQERTSWRSRFTDPNRRSQGGQHGRFPSESQRQQQAGFDDEAARIQQEVVAARAFYPFIGQGSQHNVNDAQATQQQATAADGRQPSFPPAPRAEEVLPPLPVAFTFERLAPEPTSSQGMPRSFHRMAWYSGSF